MLILDEPTASLSHKEIEHLFKLIKHLKTQGLGILYVSHRLDEIFEIADEITIIKDGQVTSKGDITHYDHDKIISKMVGRELADMFPTKRKEDSPTHTLLSVKNLKYNHWQKGINIEVLAGEIVGLAGLVGSGRTEIIEMIYGLRDSIDGEVIFNGKPYHKRSPQNSLDRGIVMLTESRKIDGLFLDHSVARNFTATTIDKGHHYLKLFSGISEKRCNDSLDSMRVKLNSVAQSISDLSGGNQQKILLGRILQNEPQLLLLDEPTRGVDIGAKVQIYKLLRDIAHKGCGILVVSSELIELVGLCDRVYVLKEQNIVATLEQDEISEVGIIKTRSMIY